MRGAFRSALAILTLLTAAPALAAPEEAPAPQALEWTPGKDVFSVGRELTIDRKVEGALSVAGEIVILTRDAEVDGDTWIAGRRVAVEGELDGDLSIRAQEALVNGEVKGDVTFYGLDLSLGPDADIGGNVTYYSPSTARIDKAAKIGGEVNGHDVGEAREASPPPGPRGETRERWRNEHMDEREDGRGLSAPGYHMSASGAVFFGVLAVVMALLAPATTVRMRDGLAAEAGLAFGLGLLWLVGIPVLAVLVAITIVGLPLAFLLLLLWPLGMVFGLVAFLAAFGDFLSSRLGETGKGTFGRVVGIIIATAIVWIAIAIPVLGALAWLVAVAGGIGLLYIGFRNTPV